MTRENRVGLIFLVAGLILGWLGLEVEASKLAEVYATIFTSLWSVSFIIIGLIGIWMKK